MKKKEQNKKTTTGYITPTKDGYNVGYVMVVFGLLGCWVGGLLGCLCWFVRGYGVGWVNN